MRGILGVLLCLATSVGYGRSSSIPERRDFPLSPEIKPCENFYNHVCAKVMDSFELREDRSSHTFSFSDSAERLLEKRKGYFKGLSTAKPETDRESALKNFYLACMDTKTRALEEKKESEKYQKLFSKMSTRDEFLDWLEKAYLEPEGTPLGWGSINNLDQSTNNDLYFTAGFITLPEKSYYKNEAVMKDFRELATAFFRTIKTKDPIKDADNLLKFEAGLAEVNPTPQEFRQIINNRSFTTREDLIKNYPHLRLTKIFAAVPESIVIRHWIPDAMKYLENYLSTANVEQLRPLFLFHSIYNFIDESNPTFFKQRFEFNKKHFGGSNVRPPIDERCTQHAMGTFTKEIDAILLPRIFPDFPKEKFIALAEDIRKSIVRSLEKNEWLSKDAKAEALKKITSARLQLVSPNTEKEWDFLPAAQYNPKEYIGNGKKVSNLLQEKTLKEFREPNDPNRWGMGPLTVNAYYEPAFNKFVMPIGILQYPFYDPKMSLDENFAAVGTVIGHELGHGVDDQGSRYDSVGKQRLWMSMKDLAEFSKRTELLVEQFAAANHNGKLTLGENIGDLVGLTSSLSAAAQDPEFRKSPERQKAFFTAYARLWCEIKRPKLIETFLKTNPHSLGIARVNEQMKQQPLFKEAFQCKESDPMVLPKEKMVRIW